MCAHRVSDQILGGAFIDERERAIDPFRLKLAVNPCTWNISEKYTAHNLECNRLIALLDELRRELLARCRGGEHDRIAHRRKTGRAQNNMTRVRVVDSVSQCVLEFHCVANLREVYPAAEREHVARNKPETKY